MADMFRMKMADGEILVPIIDHSNWKEEMVYTDGSEVKGRGYVERDFKVNPVGCYENVPAMKDVNIQLYQPSDYSALCKSRVETKTRLSDIRMRGNFGKMIPSLDQGQVGYCWAHSSVGAVQILRAILNLAYVPLSAYAVAATIKNGRDEGGWGALSLEFIMKYGVPSQALWPQGDRNTHLWTPDCQANAALHKVTDGWVDLEAAVYDRTLSKQQVCTLLLSRIPVVLDYNWWGHSVLGLDLVEIEPGDFGVLILNSWGDGWKDHGMAVLRGSQAWPDGAVAPTTVTASLKAHVAAIKALAI